MPEEYFDVAWINFDTAILHGRAALGRDKYGVRVEANIEQRLTAEQASKIQDMRDRHQCEMDRLLASLLDRAALTDGGNDDR